jgi:DNA helicase-4
MTGRLSTVSAGRNYPHDGLPPLFWEGDRSDLDTTYRFNARIGEIANRFIQQNPHQLSKPLNSLTSGDKKAVTLLADDQLEPLLDKLSVCETG